MADWIMTQGSNFFHPLDTLLVGWNSTTVALFRRWRYCNNRCEI